jgi:hypothetical protein
MITINKTKKISFNFSKNKASKQASKQQQAENSTFQIIEFAESLVPL